MTEETVTDAEGKTVLQYCYTHGLNGEILTITETEGGIVTKVSYTYDKEMRLTEEAYSSDAGSMDITYTYDATGNRISKETTVTGDITGMVTETEAVEEGKVIYTYNAWNQLICATHEGDTTDFTYDTSGAVTNTKGEKNITYTYDAKGRLISHVTKSDGDSVITEYTYDYQGTRSSKSVNAAETRYVTYTMSGLSYVLCETDLWGNVTAEYVRGAQLHTMTKDDATYVYLSDAHLNVRAMADADGTLINRYRYDAWGRTLYEEETIENPYRYCQEEYDAESGNTYLRARYYSAESANFLSADVYAGSIDNPMSLNKYAYAGANPVMYADPSGYMFTMAECLTATNIQNILRTSVTARVLTFGTLGGLGGGAFAAGDVLSEGGNWQEAWYAFCEGFIDGGCIGMFLGALPTKMLFDMAVTMLAFIGFTSSMYGAGESWSEGKYWQALYRFGVGAFTIAFWYGEYGAEGEGILQNVLKQLKGKGKSGNDKSLFLPDEFYNKNLPSQVTPGTKYLPKYDEVGNIKQIKLYDDYGREIGWVDYTNHGYGNVNSPHYHTTPHWHEKGYNAQYPDGIKINHRTDINTPLGDK